MASSQAQAKKQDKINRIFEAANEFFASSEYREMCMSKHPRFCLIWNCEENLLLRGGR